MACLQVIPHIETEADVGSSFGFVSFFCSCYDKYSPRSKCVN